MLESMGISVEFSHHEGGPGQQEIDLRYADALSHRRQHHDLPHRDQGGGAEPGHLGVVHAQAVHRRTPARACTPTCRCSRATATPSSRPARSTSCPRPAARSSPACSSTPPRSPRSPTSGSTPTSGCSAAARRRRTSAGATTTARRWSGCRCTSRTRASRPGSSCARIDAACNPYLAFAVMLAAGLKGIEEGYELPREAEDDVWSLTDARAPARSASSRCRRTCYEAIAIDGGQSELVAETLGEHVFDFFLRNKRAEWEDYRGQVSAVRARPDAAGPVTASPASPMTARSWSSQHEADCPPALVRRAGSTDAGLRARRRAARTPATRCPARSAAYDALRRARRRRWAPTTTTPAPWLTPTKELIARRGRRPACRRSASASATSCWRVGAAAARSSRNPRGPAGRRCSTSGWLPDAADDPLLGGAAAAAPRRPVERRHGRRAARRARSLLATAPDGEHQAARFGAGGLGGAVPPRGRRDVLAVAGPRGRPRRPRASGHRPGRGAREIAAAADRARRRPGGRWLSAFAARRWPTHARVSRDHGRGTSRGRLARLGFTDADRGAAEPRRELGRSTTSRCCAILGRRRRPDLALAGAGPAGRAAADDGRRLLAELRRRRGHRDAAARGARRERRARRPPGPAPRALARARPTRRSARPAAGVRRPRRLLRRSAPIPTTPTPVATLPDREALDALRVEYRRLLLRLAARDLAHDARRRRRRRRAGRPRRRHARGRAGRSPAPRSGERRGRLPARGDRDGQVRRPRAQLRQRRRRHLRRRAGRRRRRDAGARGPPPSSPRRMMRVCSDHTAEGTIWPVDARCARGQGRPAGPHPRQPPRLLRALGQDLGVPGAAQGPAGRRRPASSAARTSTMVAPLVWQAAERDGLRRRRAGDAPPGRRAHPGRTRPTAQLKLGPGGLRDVEFAVQLLQLVHGRADETLRGADHAERARGADRAAATSGATTASALHEAYRVPAHRSSTGSSCTSCGVPTSCPTTRTRCAGSAARSGCRKDPVGELDKRVAAAPPRGAPAAREALLPAAARRGRADPRRRARGSRPRRRGRGWRRSATPTRRRRCGTSRR